MVVSEARSSVPFHVFILSCLLLLIGCEASEGKIKSEAQLRDKSCQEAGVTGNELKACTSTEEGYRQVMESITARYEGERLARSLSKDRYEAVSLDVLRESGCCFSHFTDATDAPKHPLFGKRLMMAGHIVYIPINHEEKKDAHQWLEVRDATHLTPGQVDADIESLNREERAHIRAHCTGAACTGKFYGVIGRIEEARGLEVLGLHIEHMELNPPLAFNQH
jgi:hypothetical protein